MVITHYSLYYNMYSLTFVLAFHLAYLDVLTQIFSEIFTTEVKSCLLGVAMMATVAALLSPETTIAARRLADTGAGSSPAPLFLGFWKPDWIDFVKCCFGSLIMMRRMILNDDHPYELW